MANWWEKEIFAQPVVPAERQTDGAVVEQRTPSVARTERVGDTDRRSLVILALVAILVIAARGLDLWQGRATASESRRDELRRIIATELAAHQQGDEQAYRTLLDPLADEDWSQMQVAALTALPLPVPGNEPPIIEHWEFRGEVAMVDLRFVGPPAIRETRFYRIVADTWYRTPPVEAFWGGQQETDAPGIHFIYREADADVVKSVIEAIQTAHRQSDVPVLAGDRLTVEIVPDYLVEYESRTNRLILPSPRLSPRLISAPEGVTLLWRLAHPVADRLADPGDAVRYRYLDSIQLFQDHVRYWLMRWQVPFPERWDTQMLDTLQEARDQDLLRVPRMVDMLSASRPQSYLAYYEAMTLVDYVVERFGSSKLLALEQALAEVHSWDRAVPAALGVDLAELERGWRVYLETRLESSPATVPQPAPTEDEASS
jgi:hypothetical protein